MSNQPNNVELKIEFDDKSYSVNVPVTLTSEAQDFFEKMDQDMDGGWQMSRWWVPDPDETQRCQIVADKLLTAMTNQDESFASLMCAYILRARPTTRRIRINTDGEIQGNEFLEE
jgi:hypothetical protein